MSRQGDWVIVARTSSLEAEILHAALETADIPSVLRGETIGQVYMLSASELGQVDILVPRDRADEAQALLADSEAVDFPEAD
ncbi:MAG: putative signal transducing protein [Candidatus Dormibacteria bacterium]